MARSFALPPLKNKTLTLTFTMTNLALLLHLLVAIMIMHSATAFTFARIYCRVHQPATFTVSGSCSSQRAAFFSYRASRPLQLQSARHQQHGQTTESNNKDDDDAELMNINHRKYYSISGIGQRSSVTMETNTGGFVKVKLQCWYPIHVYVYCFIKQVV